MPIKKNYVVEKSNVLNEMRLCKMNLQEVRFLGIYLSQINARDPKTRIVKFTLDDFKAIMGLGRLNIENIENNTKKLLQKIVTLRNPITGGYSQFQLFKEIKVDKNVHGEWYVEIDAHDMALPFFFEFKKDNPYFTYKIANTLPLKSTNRIRMYELLKQHQKQGEYTYSLQDLREYLCISEKKYPRFSDFKVNVLEVAKRELALRTDICFDYRLIKKGRGGEVIAICFTIKRNDNFKDQITLNEFIDLQKDFTDDKVFAEEESKVFSCQANPKYEDENLGFLAEACDNAFSESQMQEIFFLVNRAIPYNKNRTKTEQERYTYLAEKYTYAKNRSTSKKKDALFNYFKKILEADTKKYE